MFPEQKNGSRIFVVVGIILALAFFSWRQYRRTITATLSERDVADEMKLRSKQAVDSAAEDFDVTLDYSPESVKNVEAILAKLHDQHMESTFEDSRLTKEALKWGGYVGEVIKTLRPCKWELDSAVGGPGSLPVVYRDKGESFPVRWCYKRIVNGAEDNVWDKFSILVVDRDNPETVSLPPDDQALKGKSTE